MIHLLVGHRGVGKSKFLGRIEKYYRDVRQPVICLDLDKEIEKFQQSTVAEIFRSMGEGVFREMEQDVLNNLIELYGEESCDIYISLGAGFKGEYPKDANLIWVRRESDAVGRSFLDRPRLEQGMSSFEEFHKRYQERRSRYIACCSEEFCIEEGFERPNDVEPLFLGLVNGQIEGCLSLLPENFLNKWHWKKFLKKRLKWGIKYFELRDDYLSEEMLQLALATIPRHQLLLSFREKRAEFFKGLDLSMFFWDWPLEMGPLDGRVPNVVSLHDRQPDQSVTDCGRRLERESEGHSIYLKLAVEVKNLEELAEGHRWWLEDPNSRSFLPRSESGRWQWYRVLHKKKMAINFFREATGSQIDQPTLFEWCRHDEGSRGFAAILGEPVSLSRTPGFHEIFFKKKNVSVVRIPIPESEFTELTVPLLQRFGMLAAAVTSPLKAKALAAVSFPSTELQKLGAVNTLWWSPAMNQWQAGNTDLIGLQEHLRSSLDEDAGDGSSGSLVVWGGGGTRGVLKDVVSEAHFYSARSGQPIDESNSAESPLALIWAVGRSRQDQCQWPPENWAIQKVIDLNYTQDSPGLEYAEKVGAQYFSGIKMFEEQAIKQQELWNSL